MTMANTVISLDLLLLAKMLSVPVNEAGAGRKAALTKMVSICMMSHRHKQTNQFSAVRAGGRDERVHTFSQGLTSLFLRGVKWKKDSSRWTWTILTAHQKPVQCKRWQIGLDTSLTAVLEWSACDRGWTADKSFFKNLQPTGQHWLTAQMALRFKWPALKVQPLNFSQTDCEDCQAWEPASGWIVTSKSRFLSFNSVFTARVQWNDSV